MIPKGALLSPDYQQLIIDALTAETKEAISLLELAEQNPDFGDYFNNQLRQSMSAKDIYPRGEESGIETMIATPDWDANTYLTGKMIKEHYTYHPVVYEMNPVSTVNTENPVSFLIAQEVNDCDDVAGWRGDTEILMSEEEATNTQDLILFVGPGKGLAISGNITRALLSSNGSLYSRLNQ